MGDEVIVSTRERPGSYDAIETAKPGEPLFPIQGGDPLGPRVVQFWADEQRKQALECADQKQRDSMLKKATQAEQVGWAMTAYQKGEKEIEGKPARYNDQEEERDEATRTARAILIKGVGQLHNSLAIAADVADELAKLRTHADAEITIREAIALLKRAALEIEPRRGMERT